MPKNNKKAIAAAKAAAEKLAQDAAIKASMAGNSWTSYGRWASSYITTPTAEPYSDTAKTIIAELDNVARLQAQATKLQYQGGRQKAKAAEHINAIALAIRKAEAEVQKLQTEQEASKAPLDANRIYTLTKIEALLATTHVQDAHRFALRQIETETAEAIAAKAAAEEEKLRVEAHAAFDIDDDGDDVIEAEPPTEPAPQAAVDFEDDADEEEDLALMLHGQSEVERSLMGTGLTLEDVSQAYKNYQANCSFYNPAGYAGFLINREAKLNELAADCLASINICLNTSADSEDLRYRGNKKDHNKVMAAVAIASLLHQSLTDKGTDRSPTDELVLIAVDRILSNHPEAKADYELWLGEDNNLAFIREIIPAFEALNKHEYDAIESARDAHVMGRSPFFLAEQHTSDKIKFFTRHYRQWQKIHAEVQEGKLADTHPDDTVSEAGAPDEEAIVPAKSRSLAERAIDSFTSLPTSGQILLGGAAALAMLPAAAAAATTGAGNSTAMVAYNSGGSFAPAMSSHLALVGATRVSSGGRYTFDLSDPSFLFQPHRGSTISARFRQSALNHARSTVGHSRAIVIRDGGAAIEPLTQDIDVCPADTSGLVTSRVAEQMRAERLAESGTAGGPPVTAAHAEELLRERALPSGMSELGEHTADSTAVEVAGSGPLPQSAPEDAPPTLPMPGSSSAVVAVPPDSGVSPAPQTTAATTTNVVVGEHIAAMEVDVEGKQVAVRGGAADEAPHGPHPACEVPSNAVAVRQPIVSSGTSPARQPQCPDDPVVAAISGQMDRDVVAARTRAAEAAPRTHSWIGNPMRRHEGSAHRNESTSTTGSEFQRHQLSELKRSHPRGRAARGEVDAETTDDTLRHPAAPVPPDVISEHIAAMDARVDAEGKQVALRGAPVDEAPHGPHIACEVPGDAVAVRQPVVSSGTSPARPPQCPDDPVVAAISRQMDRDVDAAIAREYTGSRDVVPHQELKHTDDGLVLAPQPAPHVVAPYDPQQCPTESAWPSSTTLATAGAAALVTGLGVYAARRRAATLREQQAADDERQAARQRAEEAEAARRNKAAWLDVLGPGKKVPEHFHKVIQGERVYESKAAAESKSDDDRAYHFCTDLQLDGQPLPVEFVHFLEEKGTNQPFLKGNMYVSEDSLKFATTTQGTAKDDTSFVLIAVLETAGIITSQIHDAEELKKYTVTIEAPTSLLYATIAKHQAIVDTIENAQHLKYVYKDTTTGKTLSAEAVAKIKKLVDKPRHTEAEITAKGDLEAQKMKTENEHFANCQTAIDGTLKDAGYKTHLTSFVRADAAAQTGRSELGGDTSGAPRMTPPGMGGAQ